jgi:hypothetical protein
MKLTAHLYLQQWLRMKGAIPPLPLCALIVQAEKASHLHVQLPSSDKEEKVKYQFGNNHIYWNVGGAEAKTTLDLCVHKQRDVWHSQLFHI